MFQMKILFEQDVVARTRSEKSKDSDLIKSMAFWEDNKSAGIVQAE